MIVTAETFQYYVFRHIIHNKSYYLKLFTFNQCNNENGQNNYRKTNVQLIGLNMSTERK